MELRGGFYEIGVRAKNGSRAACSRGDALDVPQRPARVSWRSAWASRCAHDAIVFMSPGWALARLGDVADRYRAPGVGHA